MNAVHIIQMWERTGTGTSFIVQLFFSVLHFIFSDRTAALTNVIARNNTASAVVKYNYRCTGKTVDEFSASY